MINYEHYGVDDGLPTQSIYATLQDREGFLWIATDAGVSRFDGKNFTNYTSEDGLGDDEIIGLYQDKKGRIWCFPFSKKISYYYQGKFYSDKNDSMMKLMPRMYRSGNMKLVEDAGGNIYIPSTHVNTEGIKKISPDNRVTTISLSNVSKSDFLYAEALYTSADKRRVFCVLDSDSKIVEILPSGKTVDVTPADLPKIVHWYRWYTNYNTGVALFIGADSVYMVEGLKFTALMPVSMLPEKHALHGMHYTIDKHSNIWMLHPQYNVVVYRYVNGQYQPGISVLKDTRANVCFDNEDNIWFPTSTLGLFKMPYLRLADQTAFNINDNIAEKRITSCFADQDGSLWLGYNDGSVSKYTAGVETNYRLADFPKYFNRVLQIRADTKGDIYCVSDQYCMVLRRQSAYNYEQPKELTRPGLIKGIHSLAAAKGIFFDRDSAVYISNMDNYQLRIRPGSLYGEVIDSLGFKYGRVFNNYIDSKGRKYQSTMTGLIWIRGASEESLVDMGSQDARLKARIQGFVESRGIIFMATYSDGVIAMKDNKVIATINKLQGLSGILCRRIYCVRDTLYVATNAGISLMVFRNNRFNIIRNLGLSDGLVSMDVSDLAFFGNTMYVATSQGVSIFRLPVEAPKTVQAPVVSLLVFKANETVFDTSGIPVFPYKGQRVSVKFIAPVMDKPQLVQYRYRLAGKDKDWHLTRSNELEFSGLSHGDYLLEIQAKKYNSDWGLSKIIRFTITPPFYYTSWFIILAIVSLVLLMLMVFRNMLRRRVKQKLIEIREREAIEKERNRIAADIHDDIGSELTNIVILSKILRGGEQQSVAANSVIDKLETSSNELISKMNEVIWTLNPSNDNLYNLSAYLRSYITKFIEKYSLQVNLEIDANMYTEQKLSAEYRRNIFLIVKEALHNIVKHSGADSIDIKLSGNPEGSVQVKICDNGHGFDTATAKSGNGLLNIRKRTESMKGLLHIESGPGKGTCITVTVDL